MCERQIIYQFYLEFEDYLSSLSLNVYSKNALFVSARVPRILYLFIIYVPFCRICFSQRNYFGRLEI
jgi:hypothetical protein